MKQKLITFLVLMLIVVGLTLPRAESINAQNAVTDTGATCPVNRTSRIVDVKRDFYVSIEAQLESADLASERLYDLYQDFAEAQGRMLNIAKGTIQLEEGDSLGQATDSNSTCLNYAEAQISEMENVFNQYVQQITVRTRNFLLLESYDVMNDDLQNMQESFHRIRSNLNQFHDQLPCFVEKCVQK